MQLSIKSLIPKCLSDFLLAMTLQIYIKYVFHIKKNNICKNCYF